MKINNLWDLIRLNAGIDADYPKHVNVTNWPQLKRYQSLLFAEQMEVSH